MVTRQYLKKLIETIADESLRLKQIVFRDEANILIDMAWCVARALENHGKLLIFGNGGSAADAQHIAAEFVNRFQLDRPPLPALALTANSSTLTSIANDFSFEQIFVRQLQALALPGDVVLGISTSGRSRNVIEALKWARSKGLGTLGWTGKSPTPMDEYCTHVIHVPSSTAARIQEVHITVGHVLCDLVEQMLHHGY